MELTPYDPCLFMGILVAGLCFFRNLRIIFWCFKSRPWIRSSMVWGGKALNPSRRLKTFFQVLSLQCHLTSIHWYTLVRWPKNSLCDIDYQKYNPSCLQMLLNHINFVIWNSQISLHGWAQNGLQPTTEKLGSCPNHLKLPKNWVVLKTLFDFDFSDFGKMRLPIVQM